MQRAGNAAWIPRKGRERLDKIPFYEMFDLCKDGGTLEEILRDATVCSCAVEKAKMQMRATIQFEKPVPPVYISMMEEEIRSYFELNAVRILPIYPKSMVTPEEKAWPLAASAGLARKYLTRSKTPRAAKSTPATLMMVMP